jgi:hypothetical protein
MTDGWKSLDPGNRRNCMDVTDREHRRAGRNPPLPRSPGAAGDGGQCLVYHPTNQWRRCLVGSGDRKKVSIFKADIPGSLMILHGFNRDLTANTVSNPVGYL